MRDDVEAICREVRALSAAHDIVITAGGLGKRGGQAQQAGLTSSLAVLAVHRAARSCWLHSIADVRSGAHGPTLRQLLPSPPSPPLPPAALAHLCPSMQDPL